MDEQKSLQQLHDDEEVAVDAFDAPEPPPQPGGGSLEEGQIGEDDFKREWGPDDVIDLFDDDPTPQPPTGPEVELLLTADQAIALLDSLDPDWRLLGFPPGYPASGFGWSTVGFSEFELRAWVGKRVSRSAHE